MLEGAVSAMRKMDADATVRAFREGLRDGSLRLDPLKAETVRRKGRLGYSKPESPLYALGLDGARTYAKAMRTFRTKSGWAVRVVDGRHHGSKVSTRALYLIHEYGTTYTTRSGKTVRVPARPAFAASFRKVQRGVSKSEMNSKVRAAIRELMRTGSSPTATEALALARESEARNA